MAQGRIQHVGDHAEHTRQVAVGDLVFEVADDDVAVMVDPIHSSEVLACADKTVQRRVWVAIDTRAAEGDLKYARKRTRRPCGLRKRIGVASRVDLVSINALIPPRRCLKSTVSVLAYRQ